MRFNPPKFKTDRTFQTELKKRVDEYFRKENISRNGGSRMMVKIAVIGAMYFVPYVIMFTGIVHGALAWFLLAAIMGLGYACIGMCIMHDASHGSLSRSKKINTLISEISTLVLGAFPTNWKIQHNMIHHTYTNVHGHDEDIDVPKGLMRFEPHSPRRFHHRFQFLYAWFLYSLMSLMWVTVKDFTQLVRYKKNGLLKQAGLNIHKEFPKLIAFKLLYHSYMLLPLLLVPGLSFLTWLGVMATLHGIAGLTLAVVFQTAHVVEESSYPMPSEGLIDSNWAEHQLRTTMNFAIRDRFFSWFVGGLNFQVEHHLFPHISHVHYRRLSPIVRHTAQEFNLPYNCRRTFAGALWSHSIMLYRLGNK